MKIYPLKAERKRRGWSQTQIAEALGVTTRTVSRWELGLTIPYPYYRDQLCALFGKDAKELGLLLDVNAYDMKEDTPLVQSTTPNIPRALSSDDSLLGRQELFIQVKEHLFAGNHVALTAPGGSPGIGETTLATTLAADQQVQTHFRDGVLWARLGPDPNMLSLLTRWGKLLEVTPDQVEHPDSPASWSQALREAIGNHHLLLIIDDAWTTEDAQALQVGGPECTYLLTTRKIQVASTFRQKGMVVIPQMAKADNMTNTLSQIVQQETEEAYVLVQDLDDLPSALALIGKYLVSQSSTEQPRSLQTTVVRFYDTEGHLLMSISAGDSEHPVSSAESLPPYLAAVTSSDQQFRPQAHIALHTLAAPPPTPHNYSEEAALAVSQQPVETFEGQWHTELLKNRESEHHALRQVIAGYVSTQDKASVVQKQRTSPLLEKDTQAPESNTHMLRASQYHSI